MTYILIFGSWIVEWLFTDPNPSYVYYRKGWISKIIKTIHNKVSKLFVDGLNWMDKSLDRGFEHRSKSRYRFYTKSSNHGSRTSRYYSTRHMHWNQINKTVNVISLLFQLNNHHHKCNYLKKRQVLRKHHRAYQAKSNILKGSIRHFDTDSFPIRIDNCCTKSMSCYKEDFVPGTLKKCRTRMIKGVGGIQVKIQLEGTILWHILDDNGEPHDIVIPASCYVPSSGVRLMSPQHWSQQVNDNTPNRRGTWCATYEDSVVLQWKQRSYTKTLRLDQSG